MTYQRYVLQLILAAVAAVTIAGEATAQTGYRKTLLQWSYGTSFEGGPDVYEPLVTDRPDFTESSVPVGYGVAQLEVGCTFSHDSEGDDRVRGHSLPEALLRVGMFADWFELRMDWNYVEERANVDGVADTFSGAEDLGLGVKIGLTPQESILPETAVILQMSVPTGSADFTADEVLPGINYLYAWDVGENWSMGGSTGVNRAVDDETGDAFVLLSQSWTVGRGWGERVGSYAEWFVLAPSSADTVRTEHYLNGGFTVLLNNDVQWDIRAGMGLNGTADDFFAGTGLSLRYW